MTVTVQSAGNVKDRQSLCLCTTKRERLLRAARWRGDCMQLPRVEGSGPCLFCGNFVVTNEEQAVLDKKNKKTDMLYKKLAGDSRSQAAVDNKDWLLDYQANSARRTQIIDDESNKWLTPEQREAMNKKKEEL